MGLRRGGPLRTVLAALDKLRHTATEFAQQARGESSYCNKPNDWRCMHESCLSDGLVLCMFGAHFYGEKVVSRKLSV